MRDGTTENRTQSKRQSDAARHSSNAPDIAIPGDGRARAVAAGEVAKSRNVDAQNITMVY